MNCLQTLLFFPNILKGGKASLLIKGFVCSFPERAKKKVLHYQIWRKGQQDGAILTIGIRVVRHFVRDFIWRQMQVRKREGSIIETRIASQGEMNEKCSFIHRTWFFSVQTYERKTCYFLVLRSMPVFFLFCDSQQWFTCLCLYLFPRLDRKFFQRWLTHLCGVASTSDV